MIIRTTNCRLDEEGARTLALKNRSGLLGLLFDRINRKSGTISVDKVSLFYYPFYCAGVSLHFKRAARLPAKDVAALAAMECAFGSVAAMYGVPELSDREVPPAAVVKNQFTEDQGRQIISSFLKNRGARKYKTIPEIEIFEFGLIYKPHYACLCSRKEKTFYRIIDAETGEPNYRLDLVFKNLQFNKEL